MRIPNFIVSLALFAACGLSTCYAQNTTFTYQGHVTDNGTNFNGAGQFEFALVTSSNANSTATATANLSGPFVVSYNVIFNGNGYVTAPTVTISGGGGAGAAAHAVINGGAVTSVVADAAGSNYISAPTVAIAAPPPAIDYTTYWSNDGTSINGSEPDASVGVAVSNGLFTVVLGDATQPNMSAINASLFSQPNLQLRIWFNDGLSGFAALNPAQNLTPAPYAVFASATSNLVSGLSIQSNTNGAPNIIGGASVNYVSNGVVGATIGGGGFTNFFGVARSNSVTGDFGTVGGGIGNTADEDSTVGGGAGNMANSSGSTVGGGYQNIAGADYATVAGGFNNTNSGNGAVVGGGENNLASDDYATVSGGYFNIATGQKATVSGGDANAASGTNATVGGGFLNTASGEYSTVGGGDGSTATGYGATVPGGINNAASGIASFAAGLGAEALNDQTFVWSDGTFFSSTAPHQFLVQAHGGIGINTVNSPGTDLLEVRSTNSNGNEIRFGYYTGGAGNLIAGPSYVGIATDDLVTRLAILQGGTGAGNIGIGTTTPLQKLHVIGNILASGTITGSSDRNAKEHFQPINALDILDKVAGLPITRWDYKEDSSVTHVGPMAQDFYAAFQVGMDDKHISMVDADGVALAAIQGLNEKVETKSQKTQDQIEELKAENVALKARLDKLEQLISSRQ